MNDSYGSMLKVRHELPLILFSFGKWALLATLAGVIVGMGAGLFVWILEKVTGLTELVSAPYSLALLPLGFLISTLLVKYFAPSAKGHGTEKVIEAVHEKDARIDVAVVPVKLAATVVTLACGGSAGKEGPAAQIGAGLMSVLARFLRFSSYDRMRLVVCGVSAGFAAIFGTPVAGAVFGIEVLFVGQVFYDVLFASVLSGVVSWKVSGFMGVVHPNFKMLLAPETMQPQTFVWVIFAGVFFGLVALAYILMMGGFEHLFEKMKVPAELKALIGAAALIGLTFLAGRRYLGLGMDTIDGLLSGANAVKPDMIAFFWKMLFTSITLACGGSGGVVTPIFFIGVTAGTTFAEFFHLPMGFYASMGMVSMLAACTNAPIASILMGMELFGSGMGPVVSVACITAFLIVGHHSIYPSQRLARSKTALIELAGSERIDRAPVIRRLERSPVITTMTRLARVGKENREGKK